MEKTRGITMVANLKWTTATTNEIVDNDFRLEASVFNADVKNAINDIEKCSFKKKYLIGSEGFVKHAHYGGRAKRNYISKRSPYAIGFLGSAEMLQIKPMPEKYLSEKDAIEQFKLIPNTVLISRSGTIGNLTYVSKTLTNYLVSEHAIRLEEIDFAGYVYSFLKTKTGQQLIASKIYGAVVNQIEPEHLASIQVPDPHEIIKKNIHEKIVKSYDLRDKSNELVDEAEQLLIKALYLPPIEKLRPVFFNSDFDVENFSVPLEFLDERLDGSYHIPLVDAIIDCLLDSADKILPLGNNVLTDQIILAGRFKRHYVEEGHGVVFLGGKQIYELDPYNKKYLSIKKHSSRIEKQLFLKENMIAITCSGTIGKVNLIPKHWENWTMSQHVLRVVPKSRDIAGYLYVWLNSDYGRILIERHIYGAVIDEIDDTHLAKVPVPILKDETTTKRINELALEANKLRTEAYYLEQDAINEVNEKVIYA
jgi:type I restriction enzyme, S subunit